MTKEEIHEYLKKVDELEEKLVGEDKDTLEWLIFGYNQCAKMLNEKEVRIKKAIDYIEGEMSHHTSNGKRTRKYLVEILKGEDNDSNV